MAKCSPPVSAFALPFAVIKRHVGCGVFRGAAEGLKGLTICRNVVLAMAKPPSQPPVKPAFYKNPSKAIEKGGGFFIPGLRGPRLRYFVSLLAACLLALNHVASPSDHVYTQTVSELFTAFSTLAVFATAVTDSAAQTTATQSSQSRQTSSIQEAFVNTSVLEQGAQSGSYTKQTSAETAAWALAVCTDLTPVTHIAAFRSGEIIMATANVNMSKPDGPVLQRVQQESLPFYVSNTNDLPADVTLPFLSSGSHSVFVVPVSDCVVSFSAEISSSKPAGLSVEERRWLQAFAPRIVEGVNAP